MRLPPAKVRFVGNEERNALGCGDAPDGIDWPTAMTVQPRITVGGILLLVLGSSRAGGDVRGVFPDYWEGERDNLNVETNLGYVEDFVLFKDFEVVTDELGALSAQEAAIESQHARHGRMIRIGQSVRGLLPNDRSWYVFDNGGGTYPPPKPSTIWDYFGLR